MDQNGSNWIFHHSKNVSKKSCHIYRDGIKIISFLIRSEQNESKWIKLDKIGFFIRNWDSPPVWSRFLSCAPGLECPECPEWIKMDKTWLYWIFYLELRFSTSLESFSLLRTRSWMMLLVRFMMSSWNCSLNLCLRWAFSLSAVARFSIMALVISSKKNQPAFRALSRSAPFVPPHWNANCSWTSLALTEMKKIKIFASDHLKYFSYLILYLYEKSYPLRLMLW